MASISNPILNFYMSCLLIFKFTFKFMFSLGIASKYRFKSSEFKQTN